ncbi:MAG: thiol:disulfide interchange protein DsbA/DsbL [Gammaproteobacteria bacterium]|nr:disulfide bond formation protein DsbA [Gammaproteobacteria bacterium]
MIAKRGLHHLLALLLVLAGCGTGDVSDPDVEREVQGGQATLTPEASIDEDALVEAEDEPASARFELGVHYQRLSPTQPTSSSPEQVEVAEVFWYGCPHCNDFEPYLARWLARKSSAIAFVRIPAMWNDLLRLHARAYYTAEALGKLDEMHSAFFAEIHERGNPLDSRGALERFFGRFGVTPDEFAEAFDSYAVHTKVQRAEELARRYRITSVPSIVVNGKYTSNATLAGSYDALIELIDELAESERPQR